MDEKKLIREIKEGNESAFKALVESYKDMVVNTCYGFLQNQENAEDIAQDVFVEVYRFRVKPLPSTKSVISRAFVFKILVYFSKDVPTHIIFCLLQLP